MQIDEPYQKIMLDFETKLLLENEYISDRLTFLIDNDGKTENDFIASKIESINFQIKERQRKFNLPDNEFYQEFRNEQEEIFINNGDEAENIKEFFENRNSYHKVYYHRDNYIDLELIFYKIKLNGLPKIEVSKPTVKQSFEIGLLFAKGEVYSKLDPKKGFRYYHLTKEFENPTQLSKHLKLSRQYINDSMKESESHHNIYKNIKQMKEIVNYCEENKIDICESFKSKYLSIVDKQS
ncbi:hypothetical protein [Flavobacterium sp. GT3R68]|uniref:hypothetical protein n=1 Tax=Flavobacterium sp. GT3R68 TaxID=2594437 RepID=UPI000F89B6B3|nr:hypothetical protein [Flavobacterium sp. GT3R68]RTY89322.1 hypothetical protein EKL32_22970 [Flavobacterium sp. GSN2]TRW93882.1 hypothetical protein FNW07_02945 [Flavobacterium sp. GT3R68]